MEQPWEERARASERASERAREKEREKETERQKRGREGGRARGRKGGKREGGVLRELREGERGREVEIEVERGNEAKKE